MAKVTEKKKVKATASKGAAPAKAVKTSKKVSKSSSKVSQSFSIEVYAPQIVKVDATVISRDTAGVVLQHKRRASSKMMRTRFSMSEVIAMPNEDGEAGTVILRTNRKSVVRPLQFKGSVSFSATGATVKTVSDGVIFLPENRGTRIEFVAEEE